MNVRLDVLSAGIVVLLMTGSAILGGIMAGFFFAYSVGVGLALDRLSASVYTQMMQDINEAVLNVVFGIEFSDAVGVPVIGAAFVNLGGGWIAPYGQLFLGGAVIYVIGTFGVTMLVHLPMNEHIATWSASSPPDGWAEIRDRWARWNHARTTAAIISFVPYVAAIVSFGP